MVTPHQTRRGAGAVLILAVMTMVAACAPETEEAPWDDEPDAATEAPPPATVPLDPVGDSEVFGEATMSRSDAEILVVLEVRGLPDEGEYPAHVHEGTCAEGGPVAQPLNPVLSVNDDGTGRSTTGLDPDALDDDGPFFFQVHGRDGAPIACGDIDLTTDP